jgi:pimeloyl-ACP methyl ester carboxylesterase
MTSKPAIVVVPGAWHSPEHFAPTTELLEKAGYSVHGVHLPSVRDEAPFPASHHADSEAIRATILQALDDEGRDVLLVMHSYGGIPGTDACKGLGKEDRGNDGKTTGIVGLVYIASFVAQVGQSLATARGPDDGGARPKWQHFEVRIVLPVLIRCSVSAAF